MKISHQEISELMRCTVETLIGAKDKGICKVTSGWQHNLCEYAFLKVPKVESPPLILTMSHEQKFLRTPKGLHHFASS